MTTKDIGWIGTGRMGLAMADRLVTANYSLQVWNRTASKALPLADKGAKIVREASDLGSCEIVFLISATHHEVESILFDAGGLLSGRNKPRIIVDFTSIGLEESAAIRLKLSQRGISFLASPVSGNAKVIAAGRLSMVTSGPDDAFREVEPYLLAIGRSVLFVGHGDLARIAKICHNVMLGVVTQNLAEILVLAEKAGLKRHDLLRFLNASVMGSMFTRYKSPALTQLDFDVTFTPQLMLKDLDLGLSAGRQLGVPMPTTSVTRDQVQSLIGHGYSEDFSQLLLLQAAAAGLELLPENKTMDDGLSMQPGPIE